MWIYRQIDKVVKIMIMMVMVLALVIGMTQIIIYDGSAADDNDHCD